MTQAQNVSSSAPAKDGILPSTAIEGLLKDSAITIDAPLVDDQVQPASLDLRLGATAYRVRASFLPGGRHTVKEKIAQLALHKIDITKGAVLEVGCVYLVPLQESLALPGDISAMANPKSSTGRLDVFTRLITDRATVFDRVDSGYDGPLYAEISPRTFSMLVRQGSRLNQIRFRRGVAEFSDADLRALHVEEGLVTGQEDIDEGIGFSIDLSGDLQTGPKTGTKTGIVGYRARRHAGLIDIDRKAAYDPAEFWEPLYANKDKIIILDPDEFYILASKESVTVPPHYAAEMVPFNPLVGEFRVHYAGFFDPGFGYSAAGGAGSRAVLEIRSHDVPFILSDGQIIGRLVYEKLTQAPPQIYGQDLGSNYQSQGLKLSKHFLEWS